MTVSLCGTTTVITGNRVRRSVSSSDSRRQELTEQMWYAAEDCSRFVQRRLEMLGRHRLRLGYGEQTVPETKWNADALDTQTLLDDEVRQQGMTVPGHEKPELPACNVSTMELSASVGTAWCGRTLIMRRQAMRPRLSPIASSMQGVMECRPTLHCKIAVVQLWQHQTWHQWLEDSPRYRAVDAPKPT